MFRHAVAVAATALLSVGLSSAPVWAAGLSNDELAGAIPISAGEHVTADTTEATTDAGDAALNAYCGESATIASVWYTYTPTADSGLALDATGSSYSAGFMVFEGAPSADSMVGCGRGTVRSIAAHAGRTYNVVVFDDESDGDPANGGNLVLDVTDTGPLPTVVVALDSRAPVDKSGTAWVTGSYTCTGAARWELDIQLRQDVGRLSIYGYGAIVDQDATTCDGSARPFRIQVRGDNGKFAGGKAVAHVWTDACDTGYLCNDEHAEQTIQLAKAR